ncbi:VOC family protein [Rhizobiales bacterium]|uniref:VOC family protein n=1 Tax=Hongsoonwoonella zoysiae TaxID=2821844 RepID=UPI0015613713|nr:VOC family protein [Hongsoonwoonella zoysiae]NRG18662.1 VOC family protein [Hongsoonwoonella zoysiae]
MRILSLDHVVLTVKDIDETVAFYSGLLGMEEVTFGKGRRALQFGRQKINLHKAGAEFSPRAKAPTSGSGDLCFLVESLELVERRLADANVKIEEGPVSRTGAVSPLRSIYIRDPDGNLVELAEPQDVVIAGET